VSHKKERGKRDKKRNKKERKEGLERRMVWRKKEQRGRTLSRDWRGGPKLPTYPR
jgi:hypothetical protein